MRESLEHKESQGKRQIELIVFMSSSSSDSNIEEEAQMCLPPMPLGEILRRIDTLRQPRRAGVTNLIREVGHGDFWTPTRRVQIVRMLGRKDAHGVFQTEIDLVLGVSKSLVTRIKKQLEERQDETRWRPGRANQLTVVFRSWKTSTRPKRGPGALSR